MEKLIEGTLYGDSYISTMYGDSYRGYNIWSLILYTQETDFWFNLYILFNFCSSRHCIILCNSLSPACCVGGLVMMSWSWYGRTF